MVITHYSGSTTLATTEGRKPLIYTQKDNVKKYKKTIEEDEVYTPITNFKLIDSK